MADDLTVDASVWVAAGDDSDAFHDESDTFVSAVSLEDIRIIVPAFAVVEVACALARKLRDPVRGRQIAHDFLRQGGVTHVPVDEALLAVAEQIGADAFLRSGDALYAAAAQLTSSTLVSWDNELIRRAGAISPTDWLDANP